MSYEASLNQFLLKHGVHDMTDFIRNHEKHMNDFNDFSSFVQSLNNSTLEFDEQYLRWYANKYPATPYEQDVVTEILEKHMEVDMNRTFDFESMFDDQQEIKAAAEKAENVVVEAKAENAVVVAVPNKQDEVKESEKTTKRKHRGKDLSIMKQGEENTTNAKKKKTGRANKAEQLSSLASFVNSDLHLGSRVIQFQGKRTSILTDITDNISIDSEEQFNILSYISNERKTILGKIEDVKNQLSNLKNIETYVLKKAL